MVTLRIPRSWCRLLWRFSFCAINICTTRCEVSVSALIYFISIGTRLKPNHPYWQLSFKSFHPHAAQGCEHWMSEAGTRTMTLPFLTHCICNSGNHFEVCKFKIIRKRIHMYTPSRILRVYRSTVYYVVKLFILNRGNCINQLSYNSLIHIF